LFQLFASGVVELSPQIFEKIEMTLMLFLGAWGKMIHEKNLKEKFVTLSL
jgi:hypothetical protein